MTDRTKHTIRKKLHLTDECHQMMVLIRKRAHFTEGTLPFPFCDTRFSAQKGVSLQGVRRNFAEYARDTGVLTEKGVSRKEKLLNVRESVRDTGFSAQKGVSLHGVSRNFAEFVRDTGFLTEKGVSRKGKLPNVRKPVRDTDFW